jgi:hypothetical protein
MKLTPNQRKTLLACAPSERLAHPELHMGVLNSLERGGLLKSRHESGGIWEPRTGIWWRTTPAGMKALEE